MRKSFQFLILIHFMFIAACSSSGTGLNFISYEKEQSMGTQYAQQVGKEMKIMHDPILDNYIKNLGQKMISQGVDDPHFEYTFQVIDSPEVNAFAIPGGHLYVNLGLLKQAENESEVVGVVGHEIGHVVHRHGTKKMTDAMILQGVAIGAAAASKEDYRQYVGLGVMLFGQAGLLKYGRNAELEADRTGVDILYRTGYDANGLSSFFQKLLKIENESGVKKGGLSTLLSTHPPTHDRIEQAQYHLKELAPQKNPVKNSEAFEKVRIYLASLTPTPEKAKRDTTK